MIANLDKFVCCMACMWLIVRRDVRVCTCAFFCKKGRNKVPVFRKGRFKKSH